MDDRMGNVRTVQRVRPRHTEGDQGHTEVRDISDYEVCKYIRMENGCSADIFGIDIIIALSYRINTFYAYSFREWLKGKVLSGNEKRNSTVLLLIDKRYSC